MHKRQSFWGLDAFRIVAALLVVAIHTSPLSSFRDSFPLVAQLPWDADFFLTRVLARIAVPFFFMVTGQFVLTDFLYGKRKDTARLWQYLGKIGVLYGIAILLYLPIGIYAGNYQNLNAGSAAKLLLFDGTFYHLWYFPACITGVLLVFLLSRFLSPRGTLFLSGILYCLGLLGDSYFGLVTGIPVLSDLYEFSFHICSYTRNGFFFAPLFLVLGAVAGKKASDRRDLPVIRKYPWYLGLALSFLFMTIEAFTLKYFQLMRHDSMYLGLIPTMIFLYRILLAGNRKSSRLCRSTATWIYILHPAMIVVVRGVAKLFHLQALLVEQSLIHYAAVVALSVPAALMTASVILRLQNRFSSSPSCCRAWIELDRDALRHNVEALRSMLPDTCRLMPAVKADAYGHGAVLIARELNRLGVDAFCVACVTEGISLRRQGVKGEILILGYTHPSQFPLLGRYHLTQTVIDYGYARLLDDYGKKLHVHIGIDTGMHRLGERSDNLERLCAIYRMKHLVVDGLFTHLSSDDALTPQDQEYTRYQASEFYHVIAELKKQGFPCPKLHLQSSYGILNYPDLAEDYARVGIALYGVLSTKEDTESQKGLLRPVLSLKAKVAIVKTVNAGEPVGYGTDYAADSPRKIASLSIGYADGLPRSLSAGRGSVLINGCKAPILGRICMDQTIVDVTEIPQVSAGDTAVVIGISGDQEISAGDLAEQAGTITNEILSRLGGRLERMIV